MWGHQLIDCKRSIPSTVQHDGHCISFGGDALLRMIMINARGESASAAFNIRGELAVAAIDVRDGL